MNKVLAGETGKEKAREWGRWLATNEGQAYLAAQMDADFFEERENMDDGVCEESRKRVICNLQKKISRRRVAGLTQKEVADRLGISQSYISRLEKKIMKRLKKEIMKYE